MGGIVHRKKRSGGWIVVYCCTALIFLSCAHPDKNNRQLVLYLQENFNIQTKSGDLYLFVPSSQGDGSFVFDGGKISESLKKRLHIFSAYAPENVRNFDNYHHDKNENLKHLFFMYYNNALVQFENNKIRTTELVSL